MLLSELSEQLLAILNSHPEGLGGVVARLTVDWVTALEQEGLQVILTPQFVQYTAEESQGRRQQITIHTVKYISLIVAKSLEQLPTSGDVAPWEETKDLLDIRERCEQYLIINWPAGTRLVDIESSQVDELQLDHRNFNAVTSFGYEILNSTFKLNP